MIESESETIPCKYCGEPTLMLGTKLCDFCWELAWRIGHASQDALIKIIKYARSDVSEIIDELSKRK